MADGVHVLLWLLLLLLLLCLLLVPFPSWNHWSTPGSRVVTWIPGSGKKFLFVNFYTSYTDFTVHTDALFFIISIISTLRRLMCILNPTEIHVIPVITHPGSILTKCTCSRHHALNKPISLTNSNWYVLSRFLSCITTVSITQLLSITFSYLTNT